MNNNNLQNRIEEIKNEIKELENINQDEMINVDNEIENARNQLKILERRISRKFNRLGKSRNC